MILALEVDDLWGTLHIVRDQLERTYRPITKKDAKVISIRTGDTFFKSNYQDFQRYTEVDLAMAADPETTLPSLTEAVKRLHHRRSQASLPGSRQQACRRSPEGLERARTEATYAWDASPISLPRLSGGAVGADQE